MRRLASSADRPGCGGVGIRGGSEAEIDGASEARFGVGTDGLGARLVGGRDGWGGNDPVGGRDGEGGKEVEGRDLGGGSDFVGGRDFGGGSDAAGDSARSVDADGRSVFGSTGLGSVDAGSDGLGAGAELREASGCFGGAVENRLRTPSGAGFGSCDSRAGPVCVGSSSSNRSLSTRYAVTVSSSSDSSMSTGGGVLLRAFKGLSSDGRGIATRTGSEGPLVGRTVSFSFTDDSPESPLPAWSLGSVIVRSARVARGFGGKWGTGRTSTARSAVVA